GFIGGVLCEMLQHRGHEVVALVRRPGSEAAGTRGEAGDLADVRRGGGDLPDGRRLSGALVGERPDCVIHLAAEIASQRSEQKFREVNVEGTKRLVDACLAVAGSDPAAGPRMGFSS